MRRIWICGGCGRVSNKRESFEEVVGTTVVCDKECKKDLMKKIDASCEGDVQ